MFGFGINNVKSEHYSVKDEWNLNSNDKEEGLENVSQCSCDISSSNSGIFKKSCHLYTVAKDFLEANVLHTLFE